MSAIISQINFIKRNFITLCYWQKIRTNKQDKCTAKLAHRLEKLRAKLSTIRAYEINTDSDYSLAKLYTITNNTTNTKARNLT